MTHTLSRARVAKEQEHTLGWFLGGCDTTHSPMAWLSYQRSSAESQADRAVTGSPAVPRVGPACSSTEQPSRWHEVTRGRWERASLTPSASYAVVYPTSLPPTLGWEMQAAQGPHTVQPHGASELVLSPFPPPAASP